MQGPTTARPWLALTLAAVALTWCGFVVLSYDRSYWYDEVFTLGAAGINGTLDWQILRRDVHPPTYVLMVHWLGGVIDGAGFGARLVNLAALPPLIAAAMILRPVLDDTRMLVLGILLAANFFFFHLTLELRSYGLVLALSALGHAALLARLSGRPGADIWLVGTALALTALHFFGAALGTALLLTSAAEHLRARAFGRAALMAAAAALCVALTGIWAFGIADTGSAMGGNLWLRNGLTPWLQFIGNQPVTVLALIALLGWTRRHGPGAAPRRALWLLAPFALVLAVALAISVHTPVISARNLVVGLPGLALAVTLAAPPGLLRAVNAPLTLLVVTGLTLNTARIAGADFQHIRWATLAADGPDCAGVPLYVPRPGIVHGFAQRVFLGSQVRPRAPLASLPQTLDPARHGPGCPVIAAGWHEYGRIDEIEAFFARHAIAVVVDQPDDAAARRDRRITHGFVVRLKP